MDTFDSQGNVLPIMATEQSIVSKKIADKNGQGQGPQYQHPRKTSSQPLEEDEDIQTEKHAIDIVV